MNVLNDYPVFLPKSLDLENDLRRFGDKKLLKKSHQDKIKYLIHLLYVIPYTNHKYFKQLTSVVKSASKKVNIPISVKRLSYLFGERYYKSIINFAIKMNYIIRTQYYIPGEKSYGYKLTEELRKQTYVRSSITNKSLIQKIIKDKTRDLDNVGKLLLDKLKRLKFDYTNAKQFVEASFNAGNYNSEDQKQARLMAIDLWQSHGVYGIIDNKGFRLHTNLTNLASDLRQFLSWKGQKLFGIDISNSQPYFLIFKLLEYYQPSKPYHPISYYPDPVIFDTNTLIHEVSHSLYNKLKLRHTPYELTFLQGLPNDIQHYIYLTISGKLYDQTLDYKKQGWKGNLTRDNIKTAILTMLYQEEFDNRSSIIKEIFKYAFPNVFRVIAEAKRKDYRDFPISMQKVESDMILRVICKRLLKERPNIPIFTIHDSILTTQKHLENVQRTIYEEIYKKYKILPNLKIESY